MARARNDPHKRKAAQALNHLAAAILDVNDIYLVFNEQAETLQNAYIQDPDEKKKSNVERYERHTQDLRTIMMGSAAVREHLILFIQTIWELDEESIKVYMG